MILQMNLDRIKKSGEVALSQVSREAHEKLERKIAVLDEALQDTWTNEQRGRYNSGSYERELKEAEQEKLQAYKEYRSTVFEGMNLVRFKLAQEIKDATAHIKLGAVDRATVMATFKGASLDEQLFLLDSIKGVDYELASLFCEAIESTRSGMTETEYTDNADKLQQVRELSYEISKTKGTNILSAIDHIESMFASTAGMVSADTTLLATLPSDISFDTSITINTHNYKHQTPYQQEMSRITNNIID